MCGSKRDHGQAALLTVIVTAVLFTSLMAAMVAFGGRTIDRTRAQTAADAAALASLSGGRWAAAALAQRHGATLVSFTEGPAAGRVTVVVRVGDAAATAAATDGP